MQLSRLAPAGISVVVLSGLGDTVDANAALILI